MGPVRICEISNWCDLGDPESVAVAIAQLERDIENLRRQLPADHPTTRPNPRAITSRIAGALTNALNAQGIEVPNSIIVQLIRDIRVAIQSERTPAPMPTEKTPF